jgi:predicted N-acetyltransferase YhbS
MQIRIATAADIPALHVLVESAYRGDSARQGWTHEADLLGGQRTDPQRLATQLATPGETVLVAEQNGALIGCVAVTAGQPSAKLGMLAVDPTQQTGGLGKRLIAAAEHFARDQLDATRMEMTVIDGRAELIAFYLRRGYALTGAFAPFPYHDRGFGEPKTDQLRFVVMAKPLS